MTRTQALTMVYLRWYFRHNQYAPTQQEVADAFGISQCSARKRLCALEKKGLIQLEGGWRGVKLL